MLRPLWSRERPSTHCTGGLVGPRAGLDGTENLAPPGFFFVFSCTLFVFYTYLFLCLECPAFCLVSIRTTHNTNIHAPGEIRTRKPSKRSAADHRLRPLGHWARTPDHPARSESLYRLRYPAAIFTHVDLKFQVWIRFNSFQSKDSWAIFMCVCFVCVCVIPSSFAE